MKSTFIETIFAGFSVELVGFIILSSIWHRYWWITFHYIQVIIVAIAVSILSLYHWHSLWFERELQCCFFFFRERIFAWSLPFALFLPPCLFAFQSLSSFFVGVAPFFVWCVCVPRLHSKNSPPHVFHFLCGAFLRRIFYFTHTHWIWNIYIYHRLHGGVHLHHRNFYCQRTQIFYASRCVGEMQLNSFSAIIWLQMVFDANGA